MTFVGHPILDEIKTGIRLKPTKTVDRSAPVILAEGERKSTRIDRGSCPPPAPPLSSLAPPAPPVPRASSSSPTVSTLRDRKNSAADREKLLESIRGGVRLRKVTTKDKSAPIVEPQIYSEQVGIVERSLNESFPSQNAYPRSASEESDYGGIRRHTPASSSSFHSVKSHRSPSPSPALPATTTSEISSRRSPLTSIQTSPASSASFSSPSIPPAPPLPTLSSLSSLPSKPITSTSPQSRSSNKSDKKNDSYSTGSEASIDQRKAADFVFQEADLYVTEAKLQKEIPTGKAALGKSIFDSPEQNVSPPSFVPEHQRKLSLNSYLRTDAPRPVGPPDASFDEAALKVTSEALRREIPAGTAQGKIARFANGEVGQTNSLPRLRFKPGQLRSPFHESDTNLSNPNDDDKSGGTLPKAKSPSSGFLTQRITRPLEAERSRPYSPATQPQQRSASNTPSFARNLFERPSLPNIKSDMKEAEIGKKSRSPPPIKASTKPYESVFPQEYDRAASPYKPLQARATLVTPTMALGSTRIDEINSPGRAQNGRTQKNASTPVNGYSKAIESSAYAPAVKNGPSKIESSAFTQPSSGQSQRICQTPVYLKERTQSSTATRSPTVVPNHPGRGHSAAPLSPSIDQKRSLQSHPIRGISDDQWVTVTSPTSKNPPNGPLQRGRGEQRDHIVYTVHNGEPTPQQSQNLGQSSPRPRSTSRPAWREQSANQNGSAANGYTYSGNPSSSSTFTYSRPQPQSATTTTTSVNYTPVNFIPSPRQPRTLMHARSASEMSRPIAVRTDFLPTSPLQSIEPSPVSPLRPLEVRDVHTSPMMPITSTRNPFPIHSSTSQQSASSWRENQQNATRSTRHNGRTSSPESSMSSQQSPSSLSPGSMSPRDARNNNIAGKSTQKYVEIGSMPRPFFGTYRTSTTATASPIIFQSQRDSSNSFQVDALKAAVLEAAWNKTSTTQPQRLIAVPISSPWQKAQNGVRMEQNPRVVSPQEIRHLNPESMRGNFRFNIDVNSEAPLSIARR